MVTERRPKIMGDEVQKQNRNCIRELYEYFQVKSNLSTLIDEQKTEIANLMSAFRSQMARAEKTRHHFCTAP